jgi:plastocyanin
MRHLCLMLAAAGVAALACSGDDSPSGPTDGGGTSTVSVGPNGSLTFSPATLTVPVNTTVTWNWNSGGVVHNVTFPDGTTSGDKSSGTFGRTFGTAGNFTYLCTLHAGMNGTVSVTSSSGDTGTGGTGGGGGGGGSYP